MSDTKDCQGNTIPVYAKGTVASCGTVSGAVPENSVYSLKVNLTAKDKSFPKPGQFYMIRATKGKTLLGRPISVFHSEISKQNKENPKLSDGQVEFLILKKGKGTEELCSLEKSDSVDILGPLGNIFPRPKAKKAGDKNSKPEVCIIGGGIGVAPVAGFAETQKSKSFKTHSNNRRRFMGH